MRRVTECCASCHLAWLWVLGSSILVLRKKCVMRFAAVLCVWLWLWWPFCVSTLPPRPNSTSAVQLQEGWLAMCHHYVMICHVCHHFKALALGKHRQGTVSAAFQVHKVSQPALTLAAWGAAVWDSSIEAAKWAARVARVLFCCWCRESLKPSSPQCSDLKLSSWSTQGQYQVCLDLDGAGTQYRVEFSRVEGDRDWYW